MWPETCATDAAGSAGATEAGKDTAEVTTITRAVKAKGVVIITAAVTIGTTTTKEVKKASLTTTAASTVASLVMETSIAVAVEAAVIMADEANTLAVEAEEVVATITEVKKTKTKDVISQS